MHDNISGLLASERKEELLKLIAEQQERGEDDLEEEDRWLLEVNLDDLETTSGETQAYWLLAIKAARRAYLLALGGYHIRRRAFYCISLTTTQLSGPLCGLILPGAVSHPPEGELPSHVVPTATLFGSGPRRMKTPVTVKLSR